MSVPNGPVKGLWSSFAKAVEERNALREEFDKFKLRKCGECAKQGIGFYNKGEICNHAVSLDSRHLPPPEARACMAFVPKEEAK